MFQYRRSPAPQKPAATDGCRYRIRMDCQVTFMDRTAYAETVELSYSTIVIRMPLVATAYDLDHIHALHIRSVGVIRVRLAEVRDRDVELVIQSPGAVRSKLAQLFATQNPMTRIRPIGG